MRKYIIGLVWIAGKICTYLTDKLIRCMCKEFSYYYCRGMSRILSKSIELGSLSQDQDN